MLAAHRAYTAPSPGFTAADLAAVTPDKRSSSPRTILHLCGHKWCMNAEHYVIGSKHLNDEQTACHRGLQSAGSAEEYLGVQKYYCHHPQKCWTIVYKGDYADQPEWSA